MLNRLAAVAAVGLLAGLSRPASAAQVFAIDTGKPTQSLITFDSATPNLLQTAYAIQGLQTNEQLIGIDVRPEDGKLYGVGNSGRLYTINPANGQATVVPFTNATQDFPVVLNGTRFGVDFNPVAHALRIVSDLGQNLRLPFGTGNNPTGVVVDQPLNYAGASAGVLPNVTGIAYTNSFPGATATTLYDIDSLLNTLNTQNPPNNGTLNLVGPLGVNTTSNVGFDIGGADNFAIASLQQAGLPTTQLYSVNLQTGLATLIGTIGRGEDGPLIADVAFVNAVPEPAGLAVLALGAGAFLARRRRGA